MKDIFNKQPIVKDKDKTFTFEDLILEALPNTTQETLILAELKKTNPEAYKLLSHKPYR